MNFLSLTLFVIIIIIMCDDYDLVVGERSVLLLHLCFMVYYEPCVRVEQLPSPMNLINVSQNYYHSLMPIPMTRIKIYLPAIAAHTQAHARADIVHSAKRFRSEMRHPALRYPVNGMCGMLCIFYFKALSKTFAHHWISGPTMPSMELALFGVV